ncbi:MAG: hypothetical protein PHU23_18620 [Dehalococcoidales bacterium]|nr:hypothetical protein [Dehalococcoidales bacterium]
MSNETDNVIEDRISPRIAVYRLAVKYGEETLNTLLKTKSVIDSSIIRVTQSLEDDRAMIKRLETMLKESKNVIRTEEKGNSGRISEETT